jgi:two-component system, response regulator RegA
MQATLQAERPNLLLADDDRSFCEVLARALEYRGYAVQVAHDGAAARQVVDATAPEYAVVDLRLPDMSGLKLVDYLKRADEHTSIVVLTGYGSIATAIEAIKLGATHYLTKPTHVDQIMAAFERTAPDPEMGTAPTPLSVDRLEWEHIQRVLSGFGDNISATARALNMHRRTLQRKLSKHPPRE